MVLEFSSYIVVTRVLPNRVLYYSPDDAPAFATIEENCVSAYGKSVVYDYRVSDEHAWSNKLSAKFSLLANEEESIYGHYLSWSNGWLKQKESGR